MSTKKIRVLLFPVGREPKIVEITPDEHGSTLAEMQALVGGYVECVPVDHHLDLWCNENGHVDGCTRDHCLHYTCNSGYCDNCAGGR